LALTADFIGQLRRACAPPRVLTEAAECWPYGYDNSRLHAPPGAVVFPESHDETAAVVRACREHRVALTPRGRGTGTTGAAVPQRGGVVISFERMDRILELDAANRALRVQPGATNRAVQEHCAGAGLFWPPDPGSADYCTIGGNLACNAAGPRAVKYGTPRENTLRLKAVTGAGETLQTGALTSKSVVGLDLTRLLIGSEGTLAVITEAVLRLTALPARRRAMRALYDSAEAAGEAVCAMMSQPSLPCALELIDAICLDLLRAQRGWAAPPKARALLMIEADGGDDGVREAAAALREAARNAGLIAFEEAETEDESARLWHARKTLSPVLRNFRPCKINEDVVVPVARIAELLRRLREIGERHAVAVAAFGHAGNGNLHVNILHHPCEARAAENALAEVFSTVVGMDGSISGEHGIGLGKRDFVPLEVDAATLEVMRRVRDALDPDDILNSGKALPPR